MPPKGPPRPAKAMSMGNAIDFMSKCPYCGNPTAFQDKQDNPNKMWWKCTVCTDKPKADGTVYNKYLGDYMKTEGTLTYDSKFNAPVVVQTQATLPGSLPLAQPTPVAQAQAQTPKRTADVTGLDEQTERLVKRICLATEKLEFAAKMMDFTIRLLDRFGPRSEDEYATGIGIAKDVLNEDPTQDFAT